MKLNILKQMILIKNIIFYKKDEAIKYTYD